MTTCNDSDTRSVTCEHCGIQFDGELPKWEGGEEECPDCEGRTHVAPFVSDERKAELTAKGYSIEDIGAEYGDPFVGMFRWLNPKDADGYGAEQYSLGDAWADADQFERRYPVG